MEYSTGLRLTVHIHILKEQAANVFEEFFGAVIHFIFEPIQQRKLLMFIQPTFNAKSTKVCGFTASSVGRADVNFGLVSVQIQQRK